MASVLACVQRCILRFVFGGLLAATAFSAGAVIFTFDYGRLTVLPALTGNPGDKDWRAIGAVNPVKNEGSCDSSWAFAVTGLVEADNKIRNNSNLLNLSEQELLDCTGAGSSCSGGSPVSALRTVIDRGLARTSDYPYTARKGSCRAFTPVATIPGAGRVPPGDEVSLQNYVALGPVLAVVNASDAFNAYKGGIFAGPCSDSDPTQAVLIVGYDADSWIVKNSLGVIWGTQGYIRMARNQNLCGIANFAIAVSDDPLPAPLAAPAPTPTLSASAVGLLLLGVAALGLVMMRGHAG